MTKKKFQLRPGIYMAKNKNNKIVKINISNKTIEYNSTIYTKLKDNIYVDLNNTNWTLIYEIYNNNYILREYKQNNLDDTYTIKISK